MKWSPYINLLHYYDLRFVITDYELSMLYKCCRIIHGDCVNENTIIIIIKHLLLDFLYPSSQATITTTFQRLDLSPSSGQSKNIKFGSKTPGIKPSKG
jgi:hypothetical protein